ncbi:MAG: PDDEXK nuclease domain-containing protein [Bacteroidetes bacterium]|jgi:predicted nuclease of restriction endonuclease-like (RecB) superfamily|nr:PDDEXK nuclease domain-containing protein [Bacteroidota bacterium]
MKKKSRSLSLVRRHIKKTALNRQYRKLLSDIGTTVERAKNNAAIAVNHELVQANWNIGRHIVEFEQEGNVKAEYGSELLARLSHDLKIKFGKGFSHRNVLDMRRFYLEFPIRQSLTAELSWTHIVTLLSVSDISARIFYMKQCVNENWSVRELQRQMNASLYERHTLSRDKKGILRHQRKRKIIRYPKDIVKDPYVLDFLGIQKEGRLSEKQLEQLIIDNLQKFILELGKGFAFIARQFKIPIGKKTFSVDLVFYHRILKCFVLFDLKTRAARHDDIGQMNWYLNYFMAEENMQDDNEPIGIILTAEKDDILVEYALGGLSNKIFVSKYQLYLPNKKDLRNQMQNIIENRMTTKVKK